MNEQPRKPVPRRLRDFPDDHALLASVATSLDNLVDRFDELKDFVGVTAGAVQHEMAELNLRERERNGNIEKLFERMDKHDEHHGENDSHIAERFIVVNDRLVPLEEDLEERKEVDIIRSARHQGQRDVLMPAWKLVTLLAGSGIAGGVISRIGNVLGLW